VGAGHFPYVRRRPPAKPAPQHNRRESTPCAIKITLRRPEEILASRHRHVCRRHRHRGDAAALGVCRRRQESDVTIKTPDGECDAYFVAPTTGAHAAVLVWPDIFGLRPAMRQMGKRLAEDGYSVLVVNPFYRQQKAPTAPQGAQTPIQQVLPMMQR
jgi:hypothetical protein